jgi:HemY protein
LVKKVPGEIEGALATARAAIDAQEFAKARAALAPYLAAPTKRVALAMAELERKERSDEGRAREWMARAVHAAPDPEWTADGYVSDRWLPVSPVSGRLDAFEWRVPLTGIVSTAPVIEPEPEPATVTPIAAAPEQPHDSKSTPPVPAEDAVALSHPEPQAPKAEPIIPLVHAPDDPGPDAVEEIEPPVEPQSSGWRKLFE